MAPIEDRDAAPRGRSFPPGLIVLLVALVSNAWMLRLEFQLDDYTVISNSGWMVGMEPAPIEAPWAIAAVSYSYRPVLWAVLWAIQKLFGGHAEPWIYHLFFWCTHAAASWLLYRILRVRLGPIAGVVGGSLFAILPGGIEAASWVAAGGDQLAVLLMLVTGILSDRVLRCGSWLGVALCGVCTFCALSAKETAVAMLPALGLFWITRTPRAPFRRLAALALAAAAGVALAWTLRAHALLTWFPEYPNGQRANVVPLEKLSTAFLGFFLPWDTDSAPEGIAPASVALLRSLDFEDDAVLSTLVIATTLAVFLPLAIGFGCATRRQRFAMIALAASLVLVMLPVLSLIMPRGVGLSRAFYPASLMFSALVGLALHEATARSRWAVAAIAPLAFLFVDSFVFFARVEVSNAATIHSVAAEFDRITAAGSTTPLIVGEPPVSVGSRPLIGPGQTRLASPPFGHAEHPPHFWLNRGTLRRCPAITAYASAIRILEWKGGDLVPLGEPLAAIPGELPALEPDRADLSLFRPRTSVPTRAIAGIQIDLAAAGVEPIGIVTWIAGRETRQVRFDATGTGSRVVSIPDEAFDETWFREPTLEAISVHGVSLHRPPTLLRSLPVIVLKQPPSGQLLELMSIPRISFATDVPAPLFRITLEFLASGARLPVVWLASPSDLGLDREGTRVFVLDGPASSPIVGAGILQNWSSLATRIAPYAVGRLWCQQVEVRVEALDSSRLNAIARSEWRLFGLIRQS